MYKFKKTAIKLLPLGFLPSVLASAISLNAYAESTQETSDLEMQHEVNALKGEAATLRMQRENWEKQHYKPTNTDKNAALLKEQELRQRQLLSPEMPVPDNAQQSSNARDILQPDWLALLAPLADLLLPAKAEAAGLYGAIAIDGNISDWTVYDRINFPLDKPPYLANGLELYGKYVSGTNPVYVIAIKSPGVAIAPDTSLWLNTDQNPATGYQVFGSYGGAEQFINIYTDGVPNLYKANFDWNGALEYAYSADKQVLELVIPASALGLTAARDIDILGDLNNSSFFPEFYSSGTQFTLPGIIDVAPVRTDFSKRVGIVFSDPSKNNFYNEKAYSQLFMSLQHQAMMAGIGFDLLTEADLTNMNKLVNYDALIFPYASNITNSLKSQIRKTLYKAVYQYGIGIITADNWFTNDELNNALAGDSYQMMKQLLGITRDNGAGPVTLDLLANTVSHPAMKGYTAGEVILSSQALNSYKSIYTSYYQAIPGQSITTLANQSISGVGAKPGVIATTTGGRNVHFASASLMADSPLVWQALQWVVYGTQTPVALKMGRNNNLFISRNDMDQSQEYGNTYYDNMGKVDVPLYTLLNNWKSAYNFVGSYYINIGNNPPDQQTVWLSNPPTAFDSQPLYKKYLALGNEIGTHSYTHPHNTDALTPTQIEFEFNQSMNQIGSYLNPTWQSLAVRGGAVPGMPETVATAHEIMKHLDYLSGGGSITGAGYPGAIGYLTPNDAKVYFSPNMSFDFTLMDFGVPTGNPPVPVRLSALQAEQYWATEYDRLMKHASQPIVHWPWHDYGPTSATTAESGQRYTVAMFQNTIARAFNSGAEFATVADAAERITTFRTAKLNVSQTGNQFSATVAANNVGKFSLEFNLPTGQKIQRVNNWYAYNDSRVFLDNDGGTFNVVTGTTQDPVTRVTEMPMRSKILSLTGNGSSLNLSFQGEGLIKLALSDIASNFSITSDAGTLSTSGSTATVKFAGFGQHTLNVKFNPLVVYRNVLFGGVSQAFDVGTYTFTAGQMNVIGDNTISSIRLASGYSLKACENANGTGICRTYTASTPSILTLLSNLNDKISYLQVSKR